MLKRYMRPVLSLVLGGLCLGFIPGYNNTNRSNSSYYSYPQNQRSGLSDDSYQPQQYRDPAKGKEEIAYLDERDADIHHRAYRQGDWNYKQNWRYDRKAFYGGETQGEAYDREHPDGIGGPGMDPDYEYLQMRKFYEEEAKRNRQAAVQRKNGDRSYTNSQNSMHRTNNVNNQQVSQQSRLYSRPAYPSGYRDDNANYNQSYNPTNHPNNNYYYQ
jgi:hypothetical protein